LYLSVIALWFGCSAMDKQRILEGLIGLLEGGGVEIRYEPLGGGGGGLCKLRGENIFFVDTQAASSETAELCARAVCELIDIEKVYVRPEIRQFIEDISYR